MLTLTIKLLKAPWKLQYDGEGEDMWITDNSGQTIVDFPDTPGLHEQARRIEMLPELYEALLDAVWDKCYHCRGERPLATEAILKHGCLYDKKDCKCLKWLDLLRKVRDGK